MKKIPLSEFNEMVVKAIEQLERKTILLEKRIKDLESRIE